MNDPQTVAIGYAIAFAAGVYAAKHIFPSSTSAASSPGGEWLPASLSLSLSLSLTHTHTHRECLSVCLSVCLHVCLHVCLSVYLSVCVCVCSVIAGRPESRHSLFCPRVRFLKGKHT